MLTLLAITTLAAQGIAWSPSVQVARTYATKRGKPIMLVFGQTVSGSQLEYCLSGAPVLSLAPNFVCLRVKETDAPSFAKIDRRKVTMPVVFVEPDGTLIGRVGGFFWPSELARYMKLALATREAKKQSYKGLTKYQMASIQAFQMNVGQAERTLAAIQPKTPSEAASEAYVMIADQYRADREFKKAIDPLRQSLALATTKLQECRVRGRLASTYLRLDQLDEATAEANRSLELAGPDEDLQRIANFQLTRIELRRKALRR